VADGGAPRLAEDGRPRAALLVSGIALLAFALLPGGDPPFTLHALRVLLFTFIGAPLLLVGLPPRMLQALAVRAPWAGLLAAVSRPPVGILCFALSLTFALLPACFDFARRGPAAGVLVNLAWMTTALLAWWLACAPAGAPGKRGEIVVMVYLFLLGVPLQLAAGPVAVANRMLYDGIAPADQRTGGLLLWVPGGLLLWGAITVLWVRWARRTALEAAADDAPPLSIPGDASRER
jgi:cytochrome c oxidase assembly factor CtaG